jgi:hypothetical protein
MFNKYTEISGSVVGVLKVLTLVLAAFFVVSLATTASAQFYLTGRVAAIDKDKMTITVTAYNGPNKPLGADFGFALYRHAMVMSGDEERNFEDIRAGDWVTITYHQESGGILIAEGIAMTFPPGPYAAYAGRMQLFSFPGKVVAIDRDTRAFTVDPSFYYGPNAGGSPGVRIFAYRDGTAVMMGNERRDFRDLRVGDWVTVVFHQEATGIVITDEIAITPPPAFYPGGSARMFSLPGKIVAIDRDTRMLTVDPSYCYEPNFAGTKGVRVFAVGNSVAVMIGNERRDLRDLRVGDWVTVSFHHESNGFMITDGVAMGSPAVMGCTERQG